MHWRVVKTPQARWFILPALCLLAALIPASTSLGSDATAEVSNGSLKARISAGKPTRRAGGPCQGKGKHVTACRRRVRRHREARRRSAAARRNAQAQAPTASVPSAAIPPTTPSPEDSGDPPVTDPPEPPLSDPPTSPDPPSVTPRCDLVEGDCSIYSDLFWELQAKYERFEIGTGVYPYQPECMEAWEREEPIGCAAAIVFLYPDGTLGSSNWVIDPCAPEGWRVWEPDPPSC
jgi:hypothetical protein